METSHSNCNCFFDFHQRMRVARGRWIWVALCALIAFSTLVASDDFPIGTPHLFYLENGLEVLLVENHTVPMIAATAVIRAGSSYEMPDINGASHFLEHLLFDGTETRSQQDIEEAFDRLGGYNNAQTAKDHAAFMILVEKEKFAEGIELQTDMLFHSVLAPEQIEKERGIIIEELGQNISNNPEYLANLGFDRLRWEGTPYAYPVLGTLESIEAMEREKLWSYYTHHYTPDNMCLLVMGDFEPDEMMRLVEATYGKAKPGALVPHERPASLAAPGWRPVKMVGNGVYLWLAFPWNMLRSGGDLEAMEVLLPDVLGVVVGDAVRGQFPGEILDLSWFWDVTRSGTQLVLQIGLTPEASPENILDFVHSRITTLDPPSASLSLWQRKAGSAVDDEIYFSQRFHHFGMIHAADMARGGCRALLRRMREMVAFRDLLESARVGSPGIMKTVSESTPLVALFSPLPKQREESFVRHKEIDTTLTNGLRVIVKSESSSPVFAAHFLFQGRSAFEGPERMGWVDMAHRLLEYGVPPNLSKAELQKKLDTLRLRWKIVDSPFIPFDDYYTEPGFSFIRINGPAVSQQAGLSLVYELLTSDTIAAADLETVRSEMYGLIQKEERSPRDQAGVAVRKALLGAHPFAAMVSGHTATISAPDPYDMKRLRRDYFRPNHLILSIVTSHPADATVAMVEDIFGRWQAGEPLPSTPTPTAPSDSNIRLTIGARQAEVRLSALLPHISDEQALLMQLWTGLLSDNLQHDLRETRGLAYSVGAQFVQNDGWGWLTLRIGTRAENIQEAIVAMREWATKLQHEPLDRSELEKVQASQRGFQLIRRMARDQQAFQLGYAAFKGEDPFAPLPQIDPDPERVAHAARELLQGSQWVEVVVE